MVSVNYKMIPSDGYRGPVIVIMLTGLVVLSSLVAFGNPVLGRDITEKESATETSPQVGSIASNSILATPPNDNASWAMAGGNPANTNHLDTTGPTTPITTRWKFTLDDAEDITGTVVHRGTVYFGVRFDSKGSAVYAVDAWTGEVQWKFSRVNGPKTPAVFKDTVYVLGGGGQMYALEAGTGKVFWEFKAGGPARPPVVANRTVYVSEGGGDGKLYALDALTGNEQWVLSPESGPSKVAVSRGTVYFGGNNEVYAVDATDGSIRWRTTTGDGGHVRPPTVANGIVYAGTFHRNVYAFNAKTGEKRWERHIEESRGSTSPTVAGDTVYFGAKRDKLYAVNAQSGRTRWSVSTPNNRPVVVNGTLYAGQGPTMYALKADTGNTKAKFSVDNSNANVNSAPAVVNGSLYTGYGSGSEVDGSERSTLYALGSPDITHKNLEVSQQSVETGESVKVTVTVSNLGTGPGSYETSLTVNGDTGDSKSGTLDAGEETTLSFTLKFPENGTYTIEVGGLTQKIGVGSDASVPTATPTQNDTEAPTPGNTAMAGDRDSTPTEATSSSAPGFGVTVGFIAVGIIVAIFYCNRD